MGFALGLEAVSGMTAWGRVPKGCPFLPGKQGRGPLSPPVDLLAAQIGGIANLSQPDTLASAALLTSVSPSAVAGRRAAGYSQPGCDFISLALRVSVSLLFSTSSPIYRCGTESKAQPAELPGNIVICHSC